MRWRAEWMLILLRVTYAHVLKVRMAHSETRVEDGHSDAGALEASLPKVIGLQQVGHVVARRRETPTGRWIGVLVVHGKVRMHAVRKRVSEWGSESSSIYGYECH